MNSGFRPIPKWYPFWERVNIMVARGEAPNASEAIKMLNANRPKKVKPSEHQATLRLNYKSPYKED